jgi:hypothetical protein
VELTAFMIADAAYGSPDGKMFIHGASISRLMPPFVPWIQPQIAFVLRFRMDEGDSWHAKHTLGIDLLLPNGEGTSSSVRHRFGPIEKPDYIEGEEEALQLVMTLTPVRFPSEGLYEIVLSLDGEPLTQRPFPVEVRGVEPPADLDD